MSYKMSDVCAVFALEFTDLPSKLKLLKYKTFVSAVILSVFTTGVEMRNSRADATAVYNQENPLAIKLVSNIGHNGHFIGNGEYNLIDSSSPTYHNKVNECSLTKMNGIDSCGSDTCEKTCSDALCYEGNCPNDDFEHVVPPTIFTNCSQGGPQTCSTAEYALNELDPENGLSVVSTDEFEIDEIKIQKDTEMKVSHLPLQLHFSHMTRPTLVLIILVSLLLLILVIDVIWCNWTNQGIEKIKSTVVTSLCSGNSEPEKECVDMQNLGHEQEKHDKKFEDIRTLTKQTGQKQKPSYQLDDVKSAFEQNSSEGNSSEDNENEIRNRRKQSTPNKIAPMFRQRSRSWSSSENFQKPEDMQPLLKNRNDKHR